VNLINEEPQELKLAPLSNIHIIARGEKKIGADLGAIKQPRIIKLASPKCSYDSNQ